MAYIYTRQIFPEIKTNRATFTTDTSPLKGKRAKESPLDLDLYISVFCTQRSQPIFKMFPFKNRNIEEINDDR